MDFKVTKFKQVEGTEVRIDFIRIRDFIEESVAYIEDKYEFGLHMHELKEDSFSVQYTGKPLYPPANWRMILGRHLYSKLKKEKEYGDKIVIKRYNNNYFLRSYNDNETDTEDIISVGLDWD